MPTHPSLEEILGTPLPKGSGTTLMKVYKSDHNELKKIAKAMGMTLIKLISVLTFEAKTRLENSGKL